MFVYYDSSIWVSYFLGKKEGHYMYCKPLIDGIETTKNTIIVSHPVIMETEFSLRKKYAKAAVSGRPAESHVWDVTQPPVKRFMTLLKSLMERGRATIPVHYVSVSDHHAAMVNKYGAYAGRFRKTATCSKCGKHSPWKHRGPACASCGAAYEHHALYRHKMLGPLDMEHAYLAKYGLAAEFYTTDAAFGDLNDDPFFSPIRFNVIPRGPPAGGGGGPPTGAGRAEGAPGGAAAG